MPLLIVHRCHYMANLTEEESWCCIWAHRCTCSCIDAAELSLAAAWMPRTWLCVQKQSRALKGDTWTPKYPTKIYKFQSLFPGQQNSENCSQSIPKQCKTLQTCTRNDFCKKLAFAIHSIRQPVFGSLTVSISNRESSGNKPEQELNFQASVPKHR